MAGQGPTLRTKMELEECSTTKVRQPRDLCRVWEATVRQEKQWWASASEIGGGAQRWYGSLDRAAAVKLIGRLHWKGGWGEETLSSATYLLDSIVSANYVGIPKNEIPLLAAAVLWVSIKTLEPTPVAASTSAPWIIQESGLRYNTGNLRRMERQVLNYLTTAPSAPTPVACLRAAVACYTGYEEEEEEGAKGKGVPLPPSQDNVFLRVICCGAGGSGSYLESAGVVVRASEPLASVLPVIGGRFGLQREEVEGLQLYELTGREGHGGLRTAARIPLTASAASLGWGSGKEVFTAPALHPSAFAGYAVRAGAGLPLLPNTRLLSAAEAVVGAVVRSPSSPLHSTLPPTHLAVLSLACASLSTAAALPPAFLRTLDSMLGSVTCLQLLKEHVETLVALGVEITALGRAALRSLLGREDDDDDDEDPGTPTSRVSGVFTEGSSFFLSGGSVSSAEPLPLLLPASEAVTHDSSEKGTRLVKLFRELEQRGGAAPDFIPDF